MNVERLLGQMLMGGLGAKRQRGSSPLSMLGINKAQLGVGAIGIAIAAFEHYKNRQAATPPVTAATAAALPPPPPPPLPPMALGARVPAAIPATPAQAEAQAIDTSIADASHLIRAMICAANADGVIDAHERSGILQRAMEAGLDAATQQFLMGELRAPASLEQIVQATPASLRLETYAASMIAIDVDTDAERQFLDRLASALAISEGERQQVHQQIGLA